MIKSAYEFSIVGRLSARALTSVNIFRFLRNLYTVCLKNIVKNQK